MARTAAQQREYNRNKQRAYRAKQKTKNASGGASSPGASTPADVVPDSGVPVTSAGAGDESELEIEVRQEEQPQQEPLSLKDRIMLKFTGGQSEPAASPARRGGRRKKKGGDNLLITTMPTVIGAFVATYSQNLLPEEYKPCAPTSEEVSSIVGPLFEILGRRVEVVGEASEDALALINSFICATMYGIRAYVTYADIKREKDVTPHEQQTSLRQASPYPSSRDTNSGIGGFVTGQRNYQATAKGHSGTRFVGVGGAAYANDTEGDVEGDGAGFDDVSGQREPSEAEKVAALFRRDVQGRQQLGLLPKAI